MLVSKMLENICNQNKNKPKLREVSDSINEALTGYNCHLASNGHLIEASRNLEQYINAFQYGAKVNDSIAFTKVDDKSLASILQNGVPEYVEVLPSTLKDLLGDKYITVNPNDLDMTLNSGYSNDMPSSEVAFFKAQQNSKAEAFKKVNNKSNPTEEDKKSEFYDEDYWVKSIDLDWPYVPQPDFSNVIYETSNGFDKFRIYGEAVLPWNQSQISAVSDVNKFSDKDILALFPKVRIYTRGNAMYQHYDNLEYDDDLGVLFRLKGFTKKQMRKNFIEYPHLASLDRWVRIKGEEQTIPFWKHIEIDGEIYKTADVWEKLPDTKDLPKTPSFMNEYVTRKYILEENKGIEHKYKMRGSLLPFLTLYAPPEYYENLGYDPVEIGRKCVEARIDFKTTRNPIINMHEKRLVNA